ncbi:MAG: DUF3106 domain-containing protein [Burkholderiales bacterium]|jgi:hypothetical protein|nr:DUF3106 domain-containing protein [Burkholderiales bacterium]MBP7520405.1 DUF3106 domain-containing protein [Leptothrix sp. (in: b-proteobacteria)]HQY08989.1 DUF3106 domain-containing protein [Burkholderiaceae bacterium]
MWAIVLAGWVWLSPPVNANPPGQGPTWAELTPAQRLSLQPLQGQWQTIDPLRKKKWLEIAGRFPTLPKEQQIRLQARMTEWAGMSTAERNAARVRYEKTRRLVGGDSQSLWEAYLALPEEQRKALADKASQRAQPAPVAPPVALTPKNGSPTVATAKAMPPPTAARVVAPGTVQARVGASTRPITQQPVPPRHQQAGMPKIATNSDFVDRHTLLPQRGPQAAAALPTIDSTQH